MNHITETQISADELGRLVGLSGRRIRQLAESGVISRCAPNRFKLGDALPALFAQAGDSPGVERERERLVRAQASMAELNLAKARGEVAEIADFEKVQVARAAIIRQNVMGVAQRACLRVLGETSETVFKRVLREELALALRQSAEAKLVLEADDDGEETSA